MDLSNPNLWVLRYLQSFNSANIGGFFPPIDPFDTSALSDKILRVRVTNSLAKPNWTNAGKASMLVDSGGVNAVADSLYLRLSEPTLWVLPQYSSYFVRLSLPRYFTQATISIFAYTGTIPNSQSENVSVLVL